MKNKKKFEKFFAGILSSISDVKNTKENEKMIINIKKLEKLIKKYYLRISEKKKLKGIKKKIFGYKKSFNEKFFILQKKLKNLNTKLNFLQKKPEVYFGKKLTKNVEKTNSSYLDKNKIISLKSTKTVNYSPNENLKSKTLIFPKSAFFEGSDQFLNSEDLVSPKRLTNGIQEIKNSEKLEIDEKLDTINCIKDYINKFKKMMVIDPNLKESKNKINISQKKINEKFFKLIDEKELIKQYDSNYSNINPLNFLENN